MTAATEATPLLPPSSPPPSNSLLTPYRRLLITSFMLTIAFVYTATPLLYAFHTITCDVLYEEGKITWDGKGDRCAVREVESAAASSISLMVSLTTFSGILNLFTAGWIQRRYGVKMTMIAQTVFPAIRNLFQCFAIITGGRRAIHILQWTQLITIMGGGGGFFMAGNQYTTLLVSPEERTAAFGVVQGVCLAGTGLGYVLGGFTGDLFGAPAPFEVTFCLLVLSTLLSTFFLPYIPPVVAESDSKKGEKGSALAFLAPMKVFVPRRIGKEDGGDGKSYWGVTLLGVFTFTAVLAVTFVPFLLQLTATNSFGWTPSQNGILMSSNSLVRALFLTLVFPKIISQGRKWYTIPNASPLPTPPIPATPTALEEYEPQAGEGEEPIPPPPSTDIVHGIKFDLIFARSSIFLDGCLVAMTMLASQGWHLYVAAAILPLASGTGPACKGVVMQMVRKDQQPDALQGIALVEMVASVATVSLFGVVFAYLSDLGLARYTFALNSFLAILTAGVGLMVRFPPGHNGASSSTRAVV